MQLQNFLPTLQWARSSNVDLPRGEPSETQRLLALLVRVQAERKRGDGAVMELPTAEVANRYQGQPTRAGAAQTGAEYIDVADLYLPRRLSTCRALLGLEHALEQQFLAKLRATPPPECLRCNDLSETRFGANPYRAAVQSGPPNFHGHDFGRTIDEAREGLQKTLIGAAEDKLRLDVYARPLLWLRYPDSGEQTENVLYADDAGQLQVFSGLDDD